MGPYVNQTWDECQTSCLVPNIHETLSVKCKQGTKYQHIGIPSIKHEILKNGPVASQMVVYEDLISYQSGIYSHKEGTIIGGHAVLIVGWGVSE